MNILSRLFNSFSTKSANNWFELGNFGNTKKRTLQQLYYGTVFACVDVIAQGVASVETELYTDLDGDGSPDRIYDHKALLPFKKANQFQSGADIKYLISSYMDIHGRAYLYPIMNGLNEPIEMVAIDPTYVRVVTKKGTLSEPIAGYVYQRDGVRIPFDVDELVLIPRPSPFNQIMGVSTIEMSRLEQETDLDAIEYNRGFFERGARPSGILYTESEDPIDESVFQRLKQQVSQLYEGKNKAHKMMVLEQGLKYQQTSLNQKDMDFIEQRRFSRDEILAIFRVPKTVLAISDDVNRSNAESGEYVFAKYTLLPRLQMIYDKLNAFYLTKFQGTEKMWLDFENPVPDDLKTASDIRAKETNIIRTVNESRSEIGLPEVVGGDLLYVPLNLMPISSPAPTDGTPPQEESDQEEVGEDLEAKFATLAKHFAKHKKIKSGYITARQRYFKQMHRKFTSANRQLYSDLILEVKKAPIKKDIDDTPETWFEKLMPKFNTWHLLASGVFLRYMTEIYQQSLADQNEYFGVSIDFDLANVGASAWLKAQAQDTASSVRDSMLDKARLVIAREMEQPDFSLAKVKSEIMQVMRDEAEWRAERIARTETTNAYEEAGYKSYQLSNVQKTEWLVTDPCEQCQPNAGVVRELGKEYPTGHLHAPVHPNCMCALTPYFGERIE